MITSVSLLRCKYICDFFSEKRIPWIYVVLENWQDNNEDLLKTIFPTVDFRIFSLPAVALYNSG